MPVNVIKIINKSWLTLFFIIFVINVTFKRMLNSKSHYYILVVTIKTGTHVFYLKWSNESHIFKALTFYMVRKEEKEEEREGGLSTVLSVRCCWIKCQLEFLTLCFLCPPANKYEPHYFFTWKKRKQNQALGKFKFLEPVKRQKRIVRSHLVIVKIFDFPQSHVTFI